MREFYGVRSRDDLELIYFDRLWMLLANTKIEQRTGFFFPYRDVTITREALQCWHMLDTHCHCIVRVFLMYHTPTIYNGHLRRPLSPVGSGAVTTYFNDLGMSSPGIEPRSPALRRTRSTLMQLWRYIRCIRYIKGNCK